MTSNAISNIHDRPEDLSCPYCGWLNTIRAVDSCHSTYGILAFSCQCSLGTDKVMADRLNFIGLVKDGRIVGSLAKRLSTCDSEGLECPAADFVWFNRECMGIKEMQSNILVRIEWNDVEKRYYGKWRYFDVPLGMEDKPVASCCVDTTSKISVLWKDGSLLESSITKKLWPPCIENKKYGIYCIMLS